MASSSSNAPANEPNAPLSESAEQNEPLSQSRSSFVAAGLPHEPLPDAIRKQMLIVDKLRDAAHKDIKEMKDALDELYRLVRNAVDEPTALEEWNSTMKTAEGLRRNMKKTEKRLSNALVTFQDSDAELASVVEAVRKKEEEQNNERMLAGQVCLSILFSFMSSNPKKKKTGSTDLRKFVFSESSSSRLQPVADDFGISLKKLRELFILGEHMDMEKEADECFKDYFDQMKQREEAEKDRQAEAMLNLCSDEEEEEEASQGPSSKDRQPPKSPAVAEPADQTESDNPLDSEQQAAAAHREEQAESRMTRASASRTNQLKGCSAYG